MKVLVTGGAGFIGSRLANYYIDLGHEVFILDNYEEAGNFEIDPTVERIWCDLRDARKVADVIWEVLPDLVNHQAALIDPRRSMRAPGVDGMTNYVGTANLLAAMEEYDLDKLIFASSCAVYGNPPDGLPMVEGSLEMPECPYGVSKLASEKLIRLFSKHKKLKAAVLRYPNIYGPNQDGERDTGVIAIFARRMAMNQMLAVFGSGEASYQYLHIDDLLNAHGRATDWITSQNYMGLAPLGKFLLCNLPGESCTVLGIIEKLKSHFEKFVVSEHIKFLPARPGEQGKITMTGEGALEALGWSMNIGVDQGIASVVKALKREKINGREVHT